MSMQPENVALRWFLDRIASSWMALSLAAVAVVAVLLRCFHLFNPHNYFILSADSYFFHWLAGRIMADKGPPPDAPSGALYTLHTGLSYPLAYLAKAVGYIFGLSPVDALDVTAKLLPPILAVISLIVVYLIVSRIFTRRAGLFSALTWALFLQAVLIGGAGYLDRDGLSVLLIMAGALVFYFSDDWHLHIGRIDIGWLAAGMGVLGLEALLYLEWTFVGPVLLLVILIAYFLLRLLLGYTDHAKEEANAWHRLVAALKGVNWRTFAFMIGVNIIVLLLYPQGGTWFSYMLELIGVGGESGVAEMGGITFFDLLVYQFFFIPIVLSIYIGWKNRSKGAIFFSCWFVSFLILSLFARRVLFDAIPAACILSGVGLAFLWDWQKQGREQSKTWRKVGVLVLLGLSLLISLVMVPSFGANSSIAVNDDWQDALTYLKDKTPEESVVMTNWGYGYWILDLGQRRPVVDNGYYYYNDAKLRDVGLVYATNEPVEAVKIMGKYGANYFIFSKLDLNYDVTILNWAELDDDYKTFPDDSLFARTINGSFESEGGLEVEYRSVPNGEVVILGLTQSGPS